MKNKIEISQQQLDAMASLYQDSQDKLETGMSVDQCHKILNNYRPVQQQSRVTLRASFQLPQRHEGKTHQVKFTS